MKQRVKNIEQHNIHDKKLLITLLLIGGIIMGLAFLSFQFYLAWFCLIPLFYILEKANTKQSFLYGLLYGIIGSFILYYWVIPVATRYSGGFSFYSLLLYSAVVLYISLYLALLGLAYKFLQRRFTNLFLTGISISGVFVLLELIKNNFLQGLPWFHYTLAFTQAQNKWAIQWSSVGGFYIITFLIVFFNYLITTYVLTKDIIYVKTAIGVLVIFWGGGFLLSINNNNKSIPKNKLDAVLLNENISAETRWNDLTGDSLANVFFKLNEDAVKYNPDLIIWSESAIPWKLEPDDEFIPKVLSITYSTKADHLLGIFSPSSKKDKLVYDSAYLINYDGKITGRYDKTVLLDFLEKPFNNSLISMLPFINTGRYDKMLPGKLHHTLKSGKALIGVLICNESLSDDLYTRYINKGADLLVVMSNDAWFEGTPLQMHHFYITRMEAVMAGRDVIVNSNRGIVGIIRDKGDIEILPQSNKARILNCEANLSYKKTIYSKIKGFAIPFYLVLTFFPFFIRRK